MVLTGNTSGGQLTWEGRQGKITQHCAPLSGGLVPGLKGKLSPWAGQGFLSLFSYVAG